MNHLPGRISKVDQDFSQVWQDPSLSNRNKVFALANADDRMQNLLRPDKNSTVDNALTAPNVASSLSSENYANIMNSISQR